MTVEENIAAGLKGKGARAAAGGRKSQVCSPQAIKQKVQEMTERFRLIGLESIIPLSCPAPAAENSTGPDSGL